MTTFVKPQSGLDLIKPYVPGKPIEEVQREYGLKDVIKLASNENPSGPSLKAVAAVRDALLQLNYYPDGQSYCLRNALALQMGVKPAQIVVGNGADGIIMQTCLAYLDQDDEVIVSQSSFPVYDLFTQVMRARLVKTPLKEYGLDLDAMADAITPKTTGTIVTAAEVDAFMPRVPDHVLVIYDEAYAEYVDSDEYPDSMRYIHEGRKNVLIMRTYSKIYGLAGIRLGYGIGDPELLAPLGKIKEPFSVNSLAQAAGVAALDDVEFLQASIRHNHEARQYLYREFDRLGLFYIQSHTNFIMVKIGPQACEMGHELLKRGVIIRPCDGYDLPEFLRITLGTPDQNMRLVAALEQVLVDARQTQ
jgi:histidinol-phosphate aminotransferase